MTQAGALPALAGLQKDSVVFTRCYTPNPESSPARASLLTGVDPSVHGLWTNGVALPDHRDTFVRLMAQTGYSTYLAGRYQLAGVSRWTTEKIRVGEFTDVDWAHGPLHRSRQNAYLNWLEQAAPEQYCSLFPTQANPEYTSVSQQQRECLDHLPERLSFNYWVGEQVGQWINAIPVNNPFLAIAGFSVGDGLGAEAQPEGECLNKLALQQADAALGRVVEQLRASNRLDDTVVVVASARGNNSAENASCEMDERSIKVPLMFYQTDREQRVIDTPVSTIDIAPTVLSLANMHDRAGMQGCALPGAVDASEIPTGWVMSRLRSTGANGLPNWKTALCTDTLKLVVKHNNESNGEDTLRFYNLESDPEELKNLANDQTHASELENMIDQMIDARCALEDRTEPRIAEF